MSMDDLYPGGLPEPQSLDIPRPDPQPISNSIIPFILQGLRRQKRRELIKELIREVAHDANFDLTEFVTKDDVEQAVREVIEDTRRTENFLTMSDLEHYVDHDLDLSDFVKLDELAEKIEEELGNNDLVQKAAEGAVRAALSEKTRLERQMSELSETVHNLTNNLTNNFVTAHGLLSDWMRTLGFWRRLKLVFFGRV